MDYFDVDSEELLTPDPNNYINDNGELVTVDKNQSSIPSFTCKKDLDRGGFEDCSFIRAQDLNFSTIRDNLDEDNPHERIKLFSVDYDPRDLIAAPEILEPLFKEAK